jgi:hypothetical protein
MNTLKIQNGISRFTAIANLARLVSTAPLGPDGTPRVFIGVERTQGQTALVAKTLESSLDSCLVLTETNASMADSCLAYLGQRLNSIGLTVVKSEAQLRPS